jgi:hypothetical protein
MTITFITSHFHLSNLSTTSSASGNLKYNCEKPKESKQMLYVKTNVLKDDKMVKTHLMNMTINM